MARYEKRYRELKGKGYSKKSAKAIAATNVYGRKRKKSFYGIRDGDFFR